MYRRNVAAALAAGVLLAGCGGGAAVVQAADPAVNAGATAEPGEPGEPGSGNGEAGEDGQRGRLDQSDSDTDAAPATTTDDEQKPAPGHAAAAHASDDPVTGNPVPDVPPRTIVLQGFRFWPKRVTVRPGQTWTLDNRDPAIHRLRTLEKKGRFALDSGNLGPGNTYGSAGPNSPYPPTAPLRMPAKKGTYRAECMYHGNMKITIVVE